MKRDRFLYKLWPINFGHFMWRVDSLEKTLMLRGIGGRRKRGRQRMALPTRWTWVWVNSGSWWWTGRPGVLQFIGLQRDGHDWVTKLNWTEWLIQNLSLQSHFLTCPLQQKQKNKKGKKEIRKWFSLWFNIQEPNKYTWWKSSLISPSWLW